MQRRVNIKIQKFNNNGNNSYEIKPKNLQNERFGSSFLKIGTNVELWTKRLVKASERTSTCNSLTGRHTRIISPLIIQITFFNMVEIIFGMHKDPRIKRGKHVPKERIQSLPINKQIEIADNGKTKITHDLMI